MSFHAHVRPQPLGGAADSIANTAAQAPMDWPVEAWRALAAWMVVLAHFGPPAGLGGPVTGFAFTGVDLFFVLSGYVFGPYWLQAQPQCWSAYALRRVFRIYPAYLVALAVMVALAWLQQRPLLHLPEHLLFLHVQSREMAFYYNPAFWSLPAEVGFYLLLPWLAGWSAARPVRLWALAAAALALRAALTLGADATEQNAAYVALHNLPGIAVEFAFGIAARAGRVRWEMAYGERAHGGRVFVRWRVAALALAVASWYGLALVFAQARAQGWGFAAENALTLLTVPCFALAVAVSTTGRSERLKDQALSAPRWWVRLALWLGGLSYGVYLTHVAWLQAAEYWQSRWGTVPAFAAALLATAFSAWALHRWCEAPARRFGRRWAQRLQAR